MSDDHSELEPPLPIPNRAVKRLSADDSADYPCESRTSSGTHKRKRPGRKVGAFLFVMLTVLLERSDNTSGGNTSLESGPDFAAGLYLATVVAPACCGEG